MKVLKHALFTLVLLLISYGAIELFVGTYFSLRLKQIVTPPKLATVLLGQEWDASSLRDCPYAETLGPHPILGYSIHTAVRENCKNLDQLYVNNKGLSGPDYPYKRDNDVFVILLTGGSVADQLGRVTTGVKHYLTEYFNTHFIPPRGKRFQVIVSALGDYRFPQNIFSALDNSEIIDGVIDLSGFNESFNHKYENVFGSPSENYWIQFELEARQEEYNQRKRSFKLVQWMKNSLCRLSYSCVFLVEKRLSMMIKAPESSGRSGQQRALFQYMGKLNPSELKEVRMLKHKNYYRILNASCKEFGWKCAFFIQPVPQIEKSLSKEEKIIVDNLAEKDPGFGDFYQWMTSELLTLQKENVPIYSLLDVFKEEKGQIYSDHIHYVWHNGDYIHRGNKLILERIHKTLAKSWKLQEK